MWEGACPRKRWVSYSCITWPAAIGGKPPPTFLAEFTSSEILAQAQGVIDRGVGITLRHTVTDAEQ